MFTPFPMHLLHERLRLAVSYVSSLSLLIRDAYDVRLVVLSTHYPDGIGYGKYHPRCIFSFSKCVYVYNNTYEIINEIRFFVKLKCHARTIMLSLGIKYSMRDLICERHNSY